MLRHHYPCKQEVNILGTYTPLNKCGVNNICGDGLKLRIGAASIRMAVLTNYTYLMTSFFFFTFSMFVSSLYQCSTFSQYDDGVLTC